MIGESNAVVRKQATILLLCSDPILRQVLQEVLEAQGYVVLPAGDLSGAVDWLSRVPADLLIVRHYLSGMPGQDAARYLRSKHHGLRILMVGGFLDDDRLLNRAMVEDINIFPKPFAAADFTRKVSEVLATQPG